MPPETCDAKRGDVNIAYQIVGDRGERALKGLGSWRLYSVVEV